MRKRILVLLLTLFITMTFIPLTVTAENPPLPTVSGRNIYANGTALIVDGADDTHTTIYIDTDADGVLDNGEKSLAEAGIANAPANGSNISNYTVFGGAQSGTITGDSMITVNGGMVGSVYGGNGGYNNMPGGVTIVMNGGSVARILACGYNGSVGGTGKTVSIIIHGGTVRGGVDQSINLESRNYAEYISLLIDGGMIYGQISVKSTGSFIISGGNVFASFKTGSTCNVRPTNGDGITPVFKTTLTMRNETTPVANTAVSALTTDAGYSYGIKDVQADANGKVYVYLPQGKTVTAIASGEDCYTGSVTTIANGTASGDFTKEPVILGDVTKDLAVNIKDLIRLKKNIANSAEYKSAADMNSDGVVDSRDLILLRKALLENVL